MIGAGVCNWLSFQWVCNSSLAQTEAGPGLLSYSSPTLQPDNIRMSEQNFLIKKGDNRKYQRNDARVVYPQMHAPEKSNQFFQHNSKALVKNRTLKINGTRNSLVNDRNFNCYGYSAFSIFTVTPTKLLTIVYM